MTTAQRLIDEGRVEANRAMMPRLLRFRFGIGISTDLQARIDTAEAQRLDVWIERLDTATSLSEVLAD